MQLFTGINLPGGSNPPADDISAVEQVGLIFGIIISRPLYVALQKDQGLPTGDLANEATAPSLSAAHIRSLGLANAGPLNIDWRTLFRNWNYITNDHPTLDATEENLAKGPVRWVRRVAGSGTQAAFNAFFMYSPCAGTAASTPSTATDSTPTYLVQEFGATGGVIGAVNTATEFKAGIVSRENSPGANYGFVKLDGTYPNKASAQDGRYNWVVEQFFTKNSITDGDSNKTAFFNQLATLTGSPSVIQQTSGKAGLVALPGIADPTDPAYQAQKTRYRTLANTCGGLQEIVPVIE